MTDIIARLEAATEDQQRWLLVEAIKLAHVRGWIDNKTYVKAIAFVEIGAFVDAALTLVPDALAKKPAWWGVRRGGLTYFHASIGVIEPYEDGVPQGIWAHANTPALALCSADLKAHQADDHG